jgi:hypothetical protein
MREAQDAVSTSVRRRTVAAAAAVLVVLWLSAGTPWWPPAVALTAAFVVWVLGPLLPRRLRYPLLAAGLAGAASLVPVLSVGAWLLAAAGVVARHRNPRG